MKPTPKSSIPPSSGCEVLAFGAHPDDIEFGCGGVIAAATLGGGRALLVVCSRGEAGTRGTPERRVKEAVAGAARLGATIEFVLLDGDSRLEHKPAHARALAAVIRRVRPRVVLAPTIVETQHPDHARLGWLARDAAQLARLAPTSRNASQLPTHARIARAAAGAATEAVTRDSVQVGRMVRDAARLARYGGIAELKLWPACAVEHVLFYAITPEGEPHGISPVLIDVSDPKVQKAWKAAMSAHATQSKVRPYAALQLARARAWGLRGGRQFATPLFPDAPLLFDSLRSLPASARRF